MLADVKLRTAFALSLGLTFFFVLLFFALTTLGLGVAGFWFGQNYLKSFHATAGTTTSQLILSALSGSLHTPQQTNGSKNILVLGIDTLASRGAAPALTDTIMLVSVNLKSGQIATYSLPRDLWIDTAQAKVNALYTFGIQQNKTPPESWPTQFISELTEVPIHHTVVVSLDDVSTLIDLLGGIQLDVPEGFIDPQFPRTDVDVTVVRDPQLLYEVVEFKAGPQTMSGEQALKYIRSRHATGSQGTDIARAQRQQLVLSSLIKQLSNPTLAQQPEKLGRLYAWYLQRFAKVVTPMEAIATGRKLLPHLQNLSFSSASPSIFPAEKNGVIEHPGTPNPRYFNQWVYRVRDVAAFRQEVQTKLGLVETK